MREKNNVHIVMATYNGEKYLQEQMDSLLSQTYADITVEVCDDGSCDKTPEIVKQYADRDERVSLYMNEKNQGYVKNFLSGIRRKEAQYTMLCDQDDIWYKDKVEVTLCAMREAEAKYGDVPILVYTDAMNYDSKTKSEQGRFHANSHLQVKKVDTPHLFMENKCIGCTVMINHSLAAYIEKIPEEIRVHDWWLALIAAHFGKIVYVDQPTLYYRQHSGNMIGGDTYGGYIKQRTLCMQQQKSVLQATYRQAGAFLQCYEDKMTAQQIRIAKRFATMEQANWFVRRKRVLCDGYRKSGFVRNAGLMLLI